MNTRSEILLLQYEQPDELVWNDILRFAENWNLTKRNRFTNDEPFERAIYFSDADEGELRELERILEEKHNTSGWIWFKTVPHYYPTKEEIEAHDFIQIFGDGYPDEFLLNASEALSPMQPCEICGTTDPDEIVQRKAFQVNEAFLDNNKIYPNYRYTPPGADVMNMPAGTLLVSKNVERLLKRHKDLQGYTLLDVFDQNGIVSQRLFQLKANIVILLPDNLNVEGAVCPACGTVLSSMPEAFAIRQDRLEGSSFFSRSLLGTSSIYISKLLYQLLKSENIRGLTPVRGADLIKGDS